MQFDKFKNIAPLAEAEGRPSMISPFGSSSQQQELGETIAMAACTLLLRHASCRTLTGCAAPLLRRQSRMRVCNIPASTSSAVRAARRACRRRQRSGSSRGGRRHLCQHRQLQRGDYARPNYAKPTADPEAAPDAEAPPDVAADAVPPPPVLQRPSNQQRDSPDVKAAPDAGAPPDVAADAVPPLPELQPHSNQLRDSPSSSPVSNRQSTGSVTSSSDFERTAAPMASSGLGDAGTSTLPVTASLSYRCR